MRVFRGGRLQRGNRNGPTQPTERQNLGQHMAFLKDKRALIVGIASDRSIAYGIAQAMHREGAELALTYQNDKLKPRVEKFAAEFGSSITKIGRASCREREETAVVAEYV